MTRIKYTMGVCLKADGSSGIKELLRKNQFMIVAHDEITNKCYDANDVLISKILASNHNLRYICLYSGNVPLPQEIIRRINDDPSVINYSIGKLIE